MRSWITGSWKVAMPVLVVAAALAAPAPAEAQTVTYDWFCDSGEECYFDATGSTLTNLAHVDWEFGDGSYISPTGDLDVFHDYDVPQVSGGFYFDVTLRAYYYTWGIVEIECEIYFIKAQVGGVPITSGTCSN